MGRGAGRDLSLDCLALDLWLDVRPRPGTSRVCLGRARAVLLGVPRVPRGRLLGRGLSPVLPGRSSVGTSHCQRRCVQVPGYRAAVSLSLRVCDIRATRLGAPVPGPAYRPASRHLEEATPLPLFSDLARSVLCRGGNRLPALRWFPRARARLRGVSTSSLSVRPRSREEPCAGSAGPGIGSFPFPRSARSFRIFCWEN